MRTLLVAEDNPKNMRLLKLVLRPAGDRLLEATDGEQALQLALREKPDVILMDVQLPHKSGIDVMQELRDHSGFASTPIIALTAHAMKGDRERFLALGFTGYIAKPINTRTFLEEMEAIVRGGAGP
ncbi:MAG: response regulator [Armatimonadetes bacterium]|nr:response regulator [Armatimonadota bacterium]